MQKITIEAIESKEFKIRPRGYDQEEVDTFLDEICDELDRQQSVITRLQQELKNAQAAAARPAAAAAPVVSAPLPKPQPAAVPDERFREILEMAQKVKDQTIEEAQKQAEKIKQDAEEEANKRLGNLQSEKDSLTNQVEALKKTVGDYRTRFESLLQAQQDALDKISDL